MRSIRRMAGFLVCAALVAGCDTKQPLQVDQETFELRILANGASLPALDVYDMIQDNDMDGVADPAYDWNGNGTVDPFEDANVWTFCKNRTLSPTALTPDSAPVRFHAKIDVLRAGETVAETITSSNALGAIGTLSRYNSSIPPAGVLLGMNPVTVNDNGTMRRFVFSNPRIRSRADRVVNAAITNPLYAIAPGTYGLGNGRCSNTDLGETQMDGMIGDFPIVLSKGDTVTVNIRRADTVPTSLGIINNPPGPGLRAQFRLNGAAVAVRGDTQSPTSGPGQGFTFTYTSR